MNRFLTTLLQPGARTAPVPFVFLTVALVSALQFPAHLLIQAGWVSAGVILNEVVAVAGVPIALVAFCGYDRDALFPRRRISLAVIGLLIVFTLGADIVIDYATAASEAILPPPAWVRAAYDQLMAVGGVREFAMKLVALCLVPAICEEIYFRGFCQTSLAARWGRWPAILAAAAIFAALHGNPWYLHLYFFLGIILGWSYAATGTLWAPIAVHFANNLWTFTNHVRGFRLPLGPRFGEMDIAILAFGVVAGFYAVLLLQKRLESHQKPFL